MVEFLMVGESRSSKIRRDYRTSRALLKLGVAELRESGEWTGTPKTRALALIDWYHTQNLCRTCRETPELSFSHQVGKVVADRGVLAGVLATAALLVIRTARREPSLIVR